MIPYINHKDNDQKDMDREKIEEFKRIEFNKELNKLLHILRYYPVDTLSFVEKKLLHRIDIDITHRNPYAKMEITNDIQGQYKMKFFSEEVNIEQSCENKEKCFEKLKAFAETLRVMPVVKTEDADEEEQPF